MRIIEKVMITWKFLNDEVNRLIHVECSKYDDGVRIAQEVINRVVQDTDEFGIYTRCTLYDCYIEILSPREYAGKYKVQAIPQTTYTYKASRLSDV